MLFGMSWVQLAVINCLLSNLSSAGGSTPLTPVEQLGIKPEILDSTFETYATSGSFLWLNEDEELSALVQTTNVNSSELRSPPFRTEPLPPPPPPFPASSCSSPLRGKQALLIASGLDAFRGELPSFGACCKKCEDAGLKVCEAWFYRSDTKLCFLKPHAGPDHVTVPSHAFYAGRSSHAAPMPPPPAPEWCKTVSWPFGGSCEPGCPCPARVVIGKGLGWETGWAAHRERWNRLIAITRWLGAAHHVRAQPLTTFIHTVAAAADVRVLVRSRRRPCTVKTWVRYRIPTHSSALCPRLCPSLPGLLSC